MGNPPVKKTTVLIPEPLWLEARHLALEEQTNLRTLLVEGLQLRVQRKKPVEKEGMGIFEWYKQKAEEMERGGKR